MRLLVQNECSSQSENRQRRDTKKTHRHHSRLWNELLHATLFASSSNLYSGLSTDLASLKTLMLSLLLILFISIVADFSRSLLPRLKRFKVLEASESLSYQPPFRSASLAGIASPGSSCPELGLDLLFLPFLLGCCHPLSCACALGLSGL